MATYLVWVDLGTSWVEREDATAETIVRDHSPSQSVYVAGTFEWDGNEAGLRAARETARSISVEDVNRTTREADEYQRSVNNPFAVHFPRPPEGEHPMGAKVRSLVKAGVSAYAENDRRDDE